MSASSVSPSPAFYIREPVFVIVDRFGEADPDVEQTQSAAQPAKKTVGHDGAQIGITQQEGVVGPLRGPGQNDQQHARGRTDKYEQQDQQTVNPDLRRE